MFNTLKVRVLAVQRWWRAKKIVHKAKSTLLLLYCRQQEVKVCKATRKRLLHEQRLIKDKLRGKKVGSVKADEGGAAGVNTSNKNLAKAQNGMSSIDRIVTCTERYVPHQRNAVPLILLFQTEASSHGRESRCSSRAGNSGPRDAGPS